MVWSINAQKMLGLKKKEKKEEEGEEEEKKLLQLQWGEK